MRTSHRDRNTHHNWGEKIRDHFADHLLQNSATELFCARDVAFVILIEFPQVDNHGQRLYLKEFFRTDFFDPASRLLDEPCKMP